MASHRRMGETDGPTPPSRNPMTEPVTRLRIELWSIEAPVWWRVDIPVASTLLALHGSIQVVMGWTDGVLKPDPEIEPRQYKASSVRLKGLIDRGIDRFDYVYDFGDDWGHAVIIEEVRAGDAGIDHPAFVSGHPEHERMVAWYGKRFELTDIDERRIRAGLAELARRRRRATR